MQRNTSLLLVLGGLLALPTLVPAGGGKSCPSGLCTLVYSQASLGVGRGDGVKTCPVTGEPVDPAHTTSWHGKTVMFCRPSCVVAFKKAPENFLRK